MLPLHEVEAFLQHTPAPLQEIVLELRNLVAAVSPDAVEVIRWGGLSYYHAGRGDRQRGVCQIGIQKDHVRLAFIHGAFIPDPRACWRENRKPNGLSASMARVPRHGII